MGVLNQTQFSADQVRIWSRTFKYVFSTAGVISNRETKVIGRPALVVKDDKLSCDEEKRV